VLPVLDVV
jgi:hypothetical protein